MSFLKKTFRFFSIILGTVLLIYFQIDNILHFSIPFVASKIYKSELSFDKITLQGWGNLRIENLKFCNNSIFKIEKIKNLELKISPSKKGLFESLVLSQGDMKITLNNEEERLTLLNFQRENEKKNVASSSSKKKNSYFLYFIPQMIELDEVKIEFTDKSHEEIVNKAFEVKEGEIKVLSEESAEIKLSIQDGDESIFIESKVAKELSFTLSLKKLSFKNEYLQYFNKNSIPIKLDRGYISGDLQKKGDFFFGDFNISLGLMMNGEELIKDFNLEINFDKKNIESKFVGVMDNEKIHGSISWDGRPSKESLSVLLNGHLRNIEDVANQFNISLPFKINGRVEKMILEFKASKIKNTFFPIYLRGLVAKSSVEILNNRFKSGSFLLKGHINNGHLDEKVELKELKIVMEKGDIDINGTAFLNSNPTILFNVNGSSENIESYLKHSFPCFKYHLSNELKWENGVLSAKGEGKIKDIDKHLNCKEIELNYRYIDNIFDIKLEDRESKSLLSFIYNDREKTFFHELQLKKELQFRFENFYIALSGSSVISLNNHFKERAIFDIYVGAISKGKISFEDFKIRGGSDNGISHFKPINPSFTIGGKRQIKGQLKNLNVGAIWTVDQNRDLYISCEEIDSYINGLPIGKLKKIAASFSLSNEKLLFNIDSNNFQSEGAVDINQKNISIEAKLFEMVLLKKLMVKKLTSSFKYSGSKWRVSFKGDTKFEKINIPFSGAFDMKDNIVHFKDVIIADNDMKGSINLENLMVDLVIKVGSRQHFTFINIPNVDYKMFGQAYIFGSLKNLGAAVEINFADVNYKKYKIPNMFISLLYKDGKIWTNSVEMGKGEEKTNLSVEGYLDPSKNSLNLKVENQLIEMDQLSDSFKGKININSSIEGKFNQILYNFSCNLKNGYYENIKINDLNVQIDGENDQLQISNTYLQLNEDIVELSGSLSRENQNLHLISEKIDLKFIQMLYPKLSKSGGIVELNVSLNNGHILGDVLLKDCQAQSNLKNFVDTDLELPIDLKELEAKFSFNNQEIKIEEFKGKINEGEIRLYGFIFIDEFKFKDRIVNLRIKDFHLPIGDFLTTDMDGDLQLLNDNLVGRVKFKNGLITDIPIQTFYNLPSKQKVEKELPKIAMEINISIEDEFAINLNNFFGINRLNSNVSGNFLLKNNKDESVATGTLFIKKGVIDFMDSTFNIEYGKISLAEPLLVPYIQLGANTKVSSIDEEIRLEMVGYLDSEKVQIEKKEIDFSGQKSAFNDKILRVYLSSDGDLDLDTMRSLIISGELSKQLENAENVIGQQVTTIFLAPISRRLKKLLGVQQFKIRTPSISSQSIFSIIEDAELEIVSNLYGNFIFGKLDLIFEEQNFRAPKKVNINLFSKKHLHLISSLIKEKNSYSKHWSIRKKFDYGNSGFSLEANKLEKLVENFDWKQLEIGFEAFIHF